MKRTKPLRRKTPLRSRGNTRYRRRVRNVDHMLRVLRLPCVVRAWMNSAFIVRLDDELRVWPARETTCGGRVQADHAGARAFGRKSADEETIPICRKHHGERTDYRGTFDARLGFDAKKMRAFREAAVTWTLAELRNIQ